MISDSIGHELVHLARQTVLAYLTTGSIPHKTNGDFPRGGVFVTILRVDNQTEELRGCIGFPSSSLGIYESVTKAAISAALEDPRFEPVQVAEMDQLVFEVSVLTIPEEIRTKVSSDRKKSIRIGRDGLMINWRGHNGLLLPQVPVELGWSVEEYLRNICLKAGIDDSAWMYPETKLYRFQAQVFKECYPGGPVSRVIL